MIYVITGHLGSGKSLLAVRIAHDYLRAGKRVASNITLNLDKLMPPRSRLTAVKLPYIPTAQHLDSLGTGDGSPVGSVNYDESKFGLIILDEAGSWLNARDWSEKGRRDLFRWITHARKYAWDVMLIIQDFEALDAQTRRSVTEIFVKCSRLDRVKLPYLPIKLPRMHLARGLYGGPQGMAYQTWLANGKDYFGAYYTREAVRMEETIDDNGQIVDMRAPYSLLSAWHLVGRYIPEPAPLWRSILGIVVAALLSPLQLFAASAGRSPAGAVQHRGIVHDAVVRAFPGLDLDRARQLSAMSRLPTAARVLTRRQMLDHARTALQLRDVQTARRWIQRAGYSGGVGGEPPTVATAETVPSGS